MTTLLVNLLLWVDFNIDAVVRQKDGTGVEGGYYNLLVQYSTHSLVLVVLLPAAWLRDNIRWARAHIEALYCTGVGLSS